MQVLTDNDKQVTNDLKKSISHDVTVYIDRVIARVFAGSKYASVVHEGRRAGSKMPPIEPIQRWVHMRGLAGRYSLRTGRRIGSKASIDSQDRAIAFVIARSIAKKGTPGLKFFEIALRQALPRIEREIRGFSV